jgi:hypothetical protein
MALQDQRTVIGVDHGVLLAAVDLLASVIAARTASFGRLGALAVDDGGGGGRLSTAALAVKHDEMVVDALPDTAAGKARNHP